MQAHIIVRSLYPINLFNAEEEDAPGRLDDDSLRIFPIGLQIINQTAQAVAQIRDVPALNLRSGALQSSCEALRVNGLQQIIQCMNIESAQGRSVVSRD